MAELVNRQLISARVVVSRVPTALPVVRPHQSSSARYKTCPDQWFMVESAIPSATVQSSPVSESRSQYCFGGTAGGMCQLLVREKNLKRYKE